MKLVGLALTTRSHKSQAWMKASLLLMLKLLVVDVQVEDAMRESLQDVCLRAYHAYAVTARVMWVLEWPGQIVLCASQIYWTSQVQEAIHKGALVACEQFQTLQLQDIVNKVSFFGTSAVDILRFCLGGICTGILSLKCRHRLYRCSNYLMLKAILGESLAISKSLSDEAGPSDYSEYDCCPTPGARKADKPGEKDDRSTDCH